MGQGQTARMKRGRKEERSVGACCGFGRQLPASSVLTDASLQLHTHSPIHSLLPQLLIQEVKTSVARQGYPNGVT